MKKVLLFILLFASAAQGMSLLGENQGLIGLRQFVERAKKCALRKCEGSTAESVRIELKNARNAVEELGLAFNELKQESARDQRLAANQFIITKLVEMRSLNANQLAQVQNDLNAQANEIVLGIAKRVNYGVPEILKIVAVALAEIEKVVLSQETSAEVQLQQDKNIESIARGMEMSLDRLESTFSTQYFRNGIGDQNGDKERLIQYMRGSFENTFTVDIAALTNMSSNCNYTGKFGRIQMNHIWFAESIRKLTDKQGRTLNVNCSDPILARFKKPTYSASSNTLYVYVQEVGRDGLWIGRRSKKLYEPLVGALQAVPE